VISYKASVFLSGLKGDTISRGKATRQVAEILDVWRLQKIKFHWRSYSCAWKRREI